jgi:hypothetical protein
MVGIMNAACKEKKKKKTTEHPKMYQNKQTLYLF